MDMLNNKWIRGVVPALGIHLCIGSVYAWSLFVEPIADHLGCESRLVQIAFSLAIFFLGTSAAFAGPFVEKNVRRSSLLSCACFVSGLLVTALALRFRSLAGIYLGYGCLMGIGLGIGYISPVKTLMMWFFDRKGLATGIAIMGFGFASTLAKWISTPILTATDSISATLAILAGIYVVPMLAGALLIKKPYDDSVSVAHENEVPFKYTRILRNGPFLLIWLMFFLNIHCGLALISTAKPMIEAFAGTEIGAAAAAALGGTAVAVMGVFNGAGRLAFSAVSDRFRYRANIYIVIFALSVATIAAAILSGFNRYALVAMLCVISATYGAGFSNLPTLLADQFGMRNISKIHGLSLTAWAVAGLTGNQMSAAIYARFGSYDAVLYCLIPQFALALGIACYVLHKRRTSPAPKQA